MLGLFYTSPVLAYEVRKVIYHSIGIENVILRFRVARNITVNLLSKHKRAVYIIAENIDF